MRAASFFSVSSASLFAFRPDTSFSTASAIIFCTCSAVKVVAPPAGLSSSPASFMSGKRKKRFIVSMSPGR
nr:MAG TPA: hypothetical protein [Caudoviricetes sp.]